MIKKRTIAILGTGVAGIQTICNFLPWLDGTGWKVVSIHNPAKQIYGLGESTNPGFIDALQYSSNFGMIEHLDALDATIKFGTKYEKWRENEFYLPLVSSQVAIHFDSSKLRDTLFPKFYEIWGTKFSEIKGNIESVDQTDEYVSVFVDGKEHKFDFVIDCTGHPDFNSETFEEDYGKIELNTVNRCITHNVDDKSGKDWHYTLQRATPDGWMWGIPLQSRINYGYNFNDNITSLEEARLNFANELGVDVDVIKNNKDFKFHSYIHKKIFNKRIFKNGNIAALIEPIFANALFMYDDISRNIHHYITHSIDFSDEEGILYQNNVKNTYDQIVDFIQFVYHGGSTHDTNFWKFIKTTHSKEKIQTKNKNFVRTKDIIRYSNSRNFFSSAGYPWLTDIRGLKLIDKKFGYNYFEPVERRVLTPEQYKQYFIDKRKDDIS